ncbi:MAG: HEAT repeat domain-containing protein [Thermomicrobium sp.]|nr:HEAT repeat domain-containing protein [Thermomicrobium sp.]MDW8059345.1 HEAT repeat domain-containing protein [Thermomicrobium sp.]
MSMTADQDYDSALLEGLRHPRPDIAEICAWVLGQRRTRRAVAALIAVLRERRDELDVQAAAIRALGRIGDPSAFPALVDAARSGAVPVRRAALRALVDIDAERARPMLRAIAASDPSPGVRAAAQQLLREESDP